MVMLLEVLLVALAVPLVLVAIVAAGVFILRKVRQHRAAAVYRLVGEEVQVSFGSWVGNAIDDLNASPPTPCSGESGAVCEQATEPSHPAHHDSGINEG